MADRPQLQIPSIAVTADSVPQVNVQPAPDDDDGAGASSAAYDSDHTRQLSPDTAYSPESPLSPTLGSVSHRRSSSDPKLLLSPGSPSPILRMRGRGGSLDKSGPGVGQLALPGRHSSPHPSDAGDSASVNFVPPSPTLSTASSVHFATTLDLRGNQPEASSGMSSLGLLTPGGLSGAHRRRGSGATMTTIGGESTEHGHGDTLAPEYGLTQSRPQTSSGISDAGSTLESPTQTHVDALSFRSHSPSPGHHRSHSKASGKQSIGARSDDTNEPLIASPKPGDEDKGAEPAQPRPIIDIAQDEGIDPAPFTFKPYKLASLVDPKSLESLEEMGGIEGLLKGLGTHRTRGLAHPVVKEPSVSEQARTTNVEPAEGQRHDRTENETAGEDVPGIVVTTPAGEEAEQERNRSEDNTWDGGGREGDGGGGAEGAAFAASMDDRRRVYGTNVIPQRKSKTLWQLMWNALKDKVLIILSFAAVVSLALGFFQDFGTPRPAGEPKVDWVEGVAIMVAIIIVVLVGSLNDWQKERQFKVLNEKKEERFVLVIRGGEEHRVDIKDVMVGDIAVLEPGEIVPVDGVFLSGHNVKCDESGATGESDAIKKLSYQECIALRDKDAHVKGHDHYGGGGGGGGDGALAHTDCFIISGSKVLEGYGQYLVIAVGPRSFNGRILMALSKEAENTPLQLKLNALAELIAKLGTAAGVILFTALMIRFFVQLGQGEPHRTASQKGIAFVQILIISVTLVVVAVPEGLPLAVTLALAFATKRMTKEKLLVRVLGSCETMANSSVVCTDKTGTLTQNEMTVVAGSVGVHAKFVRRLEENEARTNAEETSDQAAPGRRRYEQDFSIDQSELNSVLSSPLCDLFNSAIAINSTAFEDTDAETGARIFVGSKTETALLKFAKELGWADFRKTRESAHVVQMIPFSSERKAMGVVVQLSQNRWRLYMKGASEILTRSCVDHVVVSRDGASSSADSVKVDSIAQHERDNIQRTIIFYANQSLRTIAVCYRDFNSWPPRGCAVSDEDEVEYEDLAQGMTLIGIVGIEDPLRPGVREAVASCHRAGVSVKMCTGDNVLTARSIALQCGIYTAGGIIMEGPVFRQLDDHDMLEVVPRLQVLARSSPEDKKILVSKLRELGEIVGVTGDGTNDGPALTTADVGFSMGIAGTEVAKEASDIILMDDNFASIVKAIMWGRCVNDAVRKFLQFQISVNITAVIVTFVSAVASNSETSVLSAVQLLWINIIMDTFAALALATDPASESLLDRKPEQRSAPLFTVDMYKQILGQSMYQTVIILIFHFLGAKILGFHNTSDSALQSHQNGLVQTLVFNAFVFAQIFNSLNARRLDRRLNIFEGVLRNWFFIIITLIEIIAQVLIVFIGGAAFSVTRLGGREWGISLALGIVSIPLGALLRCIPNEPVERFFYKIHLMKNPVQPELPMERPNTRTETEWNSAIELVRDNLGTFANVRGGRLRGSSFAMKSRRTQPEEGPPPTLSSLMTMLPTIVASSVGAGWAPQAGSLSDPGNSDPSKSSAALWEDKVQVHPDTSTDDYAYKRWGRSHGV